VSSSAQRCARWLLLAWMACPTGAFASLAPDPPGMSELELTVLDPGVRIVLEEALAAERRGELDRAAARYRLVLHRDPTVVAAVLGLGRCLAGAGNVQGASEALATLPHEAEVVQARAALLEERDPDTALALYQRLESLTLGSPLPFLRQALLLAETDPALAAEKLDTWWDLSGESLDEDAVAAVTLGLQGAGELDAALALLDRFAPAWPEGEEPEQLRGLRDRIGVEREALRLAVGGTEPLDPAQAAALAAARQDFAAGRLDDALAQLRELLGRAPRSPELWATLGDIHLARGAVEEAERAYVAATTLEPDQASFRARLGMLLAERYGGRRHREAIAELSAALALRGAWAELHYRLASIQREAGLFDDATDSLQAYLALEPQGAHARDVRQLLADLERRRPAVVEVPATTGGGDVPDPARHAFRMARVYRGRGDDEQAEREAARALELAPDYLDALLLLAALSLERGDERGAMGLYARCAELAPHDARLLLTLGELHRARGDTASAERAFADAAAAGAPEARYLLADMAAERGELREARRQLEAYFEHSSGGLAHEPALALQDRVLGRLRLIRGLIAAGVASLLSLLVGALIRRRTGSSLAVLLEREPSSFHEVARLLSAIRHEVLKHNTNLLASVADRLEEGDEQAAQYAADRLFGEGEEIGVIARFDGYLRELEGVGRRHGVRLNLRHRDPVLGPMHRAMGRLRGLERSLRRPPADSGRLSRALRSLSEQLNEVGYRALGRIIQDVSVQTVELSLFEAVYRRVAAEPALEGLAPGGLELEGAGSRVPVRIFRKDLEDIAANLMRNAVFALIEELPEGERRIGVALVEEMDPITGLETLALRFRDNAPRPLTDAILRGRRIERGLGLAADLLTRHQGVMNVETAQRELRAGWTKAVVVRLPRAELSEVEED
jgi:tetratricopeptide (TPR) repeat protein